MPDIRQPYQPGDPITADRAEALRQVGRASDISVASPLEMRVGPYGRQIRLNMQPFVEFFTLTTTLTAMSGATVGTGKGTRMDFDVLTRTFSQSAVTNVDIYNILNVSINSGSLVQCVYGENVYWFDVTSCSNAG